MANFLSVNWEEAPSSFAPLKGPYSLSLWLITLCQFLFCRPEGRLPPTEGQASRQEPQHSLTFCYQAAFPSSTFRRSSKCTADRRQNWAWRSNAEQACTQSDIWLHKFKDCLKSALTGDRFKENTENPTRLGKWLSCSPWSLYPLGVFFHSYLPSCSFPSPLPSFLPSSLPPFLPLFFSSILLSSLCSLFVF